MATDKPLLLLALLFAPAFLVAGPYVRACANESAAKAERRPEILDVDYDIMESAGLYTKEREGGLGKGVYLDSRRSVLTDGIKNLPKHTNFRVLNRLTDAFLLTAGLPRHIKNDIKIEPGEDLLTLRLGKLIERGNYKDAFTIYGLLNREPYHEKLAREGIIAMLFSREKALACLDTKTMIDRFADIPFWQEFDAYCDVSLASPPKAESYDILKASKNRIFKAIGEKKSTHYSYSVKSFSELNQLERALVVADGLGLNNMGSVKSLKVPRTHIEPLLIQDKLSEADRILLNVDAVQKGLYGADTLGQAYDQVIRAHDGRDWASATSGWPRLIAAYQAIKETDDPKGVWAAFRKYLYVQSTYGSAALSPLATKINNAAPGDASYHDIAKVISILNVAEVPAMVQWLDILHRQLEKNKALYKNHAFMKTYLITYFSTPLYNLNDAHRKDIAIFFAKNPQSPYIQLKNIIENLDKPLPDDDNADGIYEKGSKATSSEDDKMPVDEVRDRLKDATKQNILSEVVLMDTLIVGEQTTTGDINPGLLYDITAGLKATGLTEYARALVAEMLLEDYLGINN